MFKTMLVLLVLLFTPTLWADETMDALNSLSSSIQEIGDPKDFTGAVIEKIKKDECRSLLSILHHDSKYYDDPEFFYAKCVYHSRLFGEITDIEIGQVGFAPLGAEFGPPFLPSQRISLKIQLNGKIEDRGMFIKFLPNKSKFELVDIDFVFGKI